MYFSSKFPYLLDLMHSRNCLSSDEWRSSFVGQVRTPGTADRVPSCELTQDPQRANAVILIDGYVRLHVNLGQRSSSAQFGVKRSMEECQEESSGPSRRTR